MSTTLDMTNLKPHQMAQLLLDKGLLDCEGIENTALLERVTELLQKHMNPVRAGIGVFLLTVIKHANGKKSLKIWLGKRKGAHGEGEWALPGGKPELYSRKLEDDGIREVREEMGVKITGPLIPLTWTNDIYRDHELHYATLYYVTTQWSGTPKVMEPDKCEGWEEFDLYNLPSPTMAGLLEAVESLKNQFA